MATEQTRGDRDYDIVLYGATGFVGRLTAKALALHAPPSLKIALAGRDQAKVEAVRDSLPGAASRWPVLEACAEDQVSLTALALSTDVVITTVGPYVKLGLPLVLACAKAGTDYVDLTGEVEFVRRSIDEAHEVAKSSGARIVHACGFDSVPSDLGVWNAARVAAEEDAGVLTDVFGVVTRLRGGMSGGTIASLENQIKSMGHDPELRRLVANPYALCPDPELEPRLGRQPDMFLAHREPKLGGRWIAPFVMASYNTRIVRRSNSLLDWSYGRGMRYTEAVAGGSGVTSPLRAAAVAAVTMGGLTTMSFGPSRMVAQRLLPSPGDGPGEKLLNTGYFTIRTTAFTSKGERVEAEVSANLEPGYTGTALMLTASALCLACDELPAAAGVLTPAVAFGQALSDRLNALDFTVKAYLGSA